MACMSPWVGYATIIGLATVWGVGRTWWVNSRERRKTLLNGAQTVRETDSHVLGGTARTALEGSTFLFRIALVIFTISMISALLVRHAGDAQ